MMHGSEERKPLNTASQNTPEGPGDPLVILSDSVFQSRVLVQMVTASRVISSRDRAQAVSALERLISAEQMMAVILARAGHDVSSVRSLRELAYRDVLLGPGAEEPPSEDLEEIDLSLYDDEEDDEEDGGEDDDEEDEDDDEEGFDDAA